MFETPIGDGARLACIGGVNKYSLWPTLWKWWERQLAERGCLQIHQYMIEHPADWTMWYLHVPDTAVVSFEPGDVVLLCFEDSLEARSHDMLATESRLMCEAYSVTTGRLTFGEHADYSRSDNGAFVIWIAFEEGALDMDHDDVDLDQAEFVPPTQVVIERRDVR
jgi:hypothetical protein